MTHAVAYTPMSFFGNHVTNMSISVNNAYPSFVNWGGDFHVNPIGQFEYTIDVSFIVDRETNVFDSFMGGIFTISRIGDSHICKYCGAMVKAGCISCHRCAGDQTQVVKDSRYHKLIRAMASDLRMNWREDRTPEVFLQMKLIGGFHYDEGMARNPSSLFNGWSTTHETDGWICKYCNSVIKGETLDCPNCGSGRVPFTDLKKMRMRCLYCGKPVNGNTVCSGCGATDNGYSMWQPRLDWN